MKSKLSPIVESPDNTMSPESKRLRRLGFYTKDGKLPRTPRMNKSARKKVWDDIAGERRIRGGAYGGAPPLDEATRDKSENLVCIMSPDDGKWYLRYIKFNGDTLYVYSVIQPYTIMHTIDIKDYNNIHQEEGMREINVQADGYIIRKRNVHMLILKKSNSDEQISIGCQDAGDRAAIAVRITHGDP